MSNTTNDPAAPYADPGTACPRYSPIRYLPMAKRTAVTRAPGQTSDQAGRAWGRTLKMNPNRTAVSAKDSAWLAICTAPTGNHWSSQPLRADRIALKTSDARSKNANPQTTAKDSNRSLTIVQMPAFGSGFA